MNSLSSALKVTICAANLNEQDEIWKDPQSILEELDLADYSE